MCIAELNVSTLPCNHRWYHLSRACGPSTNLSNCPNKLGLEGWEIKCDFCPYCAGWSEPAAFRLIGGGPPSGSESRRGSASTLGGSLNPSLSSSRDIRSGSFGRSDSLSATSAVAVSARAAGEKNRALNARLDAYLSSSPEQLLSIDAALSRSRLPRADEEDEEEPPSPTSSGDSGGDVPTSASPRGLLGKSWKKSKKFSKGLFK